MSPFGRYSDLAALIAGLGLVAAAIVAHLGIVAVTDTAWIDTSAGLAVGVILGQRSTTNGAAKIALAAHARLDAMHVPAAAHEDTLGVPG